jgi:hypothetical protein
MNCVKTTTEACIIKYILIINDTSRVVRSDAPSCGIASNSHSNDSKGVIYTLGEHL